MVVEIPPPLSNLKKPLCLQAAIESKDEISINVISIPTAYILKEIILAKQ